MCNALSPNYCIFCKPQAKGHPLLEDIPDPVQPGIPSPYSPSSAISKHSFSLSPVELTVISIYVILDHACLESSIYVFNAMSCAKCSVDSRLTGIQQAFSKF